VAGTTGVEFVELRGASQLHEGQASALTTRTLGGSRGPHVQTSHHCERRLRQSQQTTIVGMDPSLGCVDSDDSALHHDHGLLSRDSPTKQLAQLATGSSLLKEKPSASSSQPTVKDGAQHKTNDPAGELGHAPPQSPPRDRHSVPKIAVRANEGSIRSSTSLERVERLISAVSVETPSVSRTVSAPSFLRPRPFPVVALTPNFFPNSRPAGLLFRDPRAHLRFPRTLVRIMFRLHTAAPRTHLVKKGGFCNILLKQQTFWAAYKTMA
jgi:hypothetical protein